MDYHAKLRAFFKAKGLKNRSVAQTLGYGDQMMSKYLNSSPPNLEFLSRLAKHYPDLDLNTLFREEEISATLLQEPSAEYGNCKSKQLVLLDEIEQKIKMLRKSIIGN